MRLDKSQETGFFCSLNSTLNSVEDALVCAMCIPAHKKPGFSASLDASQLLSFALEAFAGPFPDVLLGAGFLLSVT